MPWGRDLAARYEDLRRRVLCGEPDGHRLGLAVLYRQGVTAWMRAFDGISPSPPRTVAPRLQPGAAADAVVAVLAAMALGSKVG